MKKKRDTKITFLFDNECDNNIIQLFIRELEQQRRLRKRHLKCAFVLLQTLSWLFRVVQFVKYWKILLELNSKRLYQSSGKEKKVVVLVHVRDIREIRRFHLVVVQRRQRNNVQKSVMHLQRCWFANLTLLFCRSRCRRRRLRRHRCLSSLFFDGNTLSYITGVQRRFPPQ